MAPKALRALLPDLGRRTLIMGVLNATPDSFSDGGAHATPEAALDRALAMMDAGADLIDVGGESTRPGALPVSAGEELARVEPVVTRLAAHGVGPISIDTSKAVVAARALAVGAQIVNDVSALTLDPALAEVVARAGAPVVLMHSRGRPETMQRGPLEYEGGVVSAVVAALRDALARATAAGIDPGSVILDPGIGFGKTVAQNAELIARLAEIKALGRPVLIGTSRKSFLGALTGRGVEGRIFATAASVALAIAGGADIVRVHDVAEMGDVVRVADAITRAPPG